MLFRSNYDNFNYFLANIDSKFSIMGVSETWLQGAETLKWLRMSFVKMERSTVHRLIGLAKYLCKFLQGLALRRLTLKNAEWDWTPRSCDSFDQSV